MKNCSERGTGGKWKTRRTSIMKVIGPTAAGSRASSEHVSVSGKGVIKKEVI